MKKTDDVKFVSRIDYLGPHYILLTGNLSQNHSIKISQHEIENNNKTKLNNKILSK